MANPISPAPLTDEQKMVAAKEKPSSTSGQTDPNSGMQSAASAAGVTPVQSDKVTGYQQSMSGHEAQVAANRDAIGKVVGPIWNSFVGAVAPTYATPSKPTAPVQTTTSPSTQPAIVAPAPNTIFGANHPANEGVTSTPEQRSAFPAPPKNGELTASIPGSLGSVTTYQTGHHPDPAQVALSQSGIPFRNGYAGVEVPAYGAIKSAPSTGMGVGKINGMDSDVANVKQADYMKAHGILNPGSDAFKINEQINQAIKNGQPFGNLLTQFDKASNRPPVNPEIPKAPEPEIEHNPFGNSTTDQVTAALGGRDKLYEDNLPDYSKVRAMAAKEAQLEASNPGQHDAHLAEVKKNDQERWARINADRNYEEAYKDQPNGDPLRDAQIANQRSLAAKDKAAVYGGKPEDYLRDPNSMNARGSDRQINELAKQALKGDSMESLVRSAVNDNSGGSVTDRRENERALAQNKTQEETQYKGDIDQMKSDAAMWKQTAMDKKLENSPRYQAAKDLNQENERLLGEITKLQGGSVITDAQAKTIAAYENTIRKNKIQSAKLRGLDPKDLGIDESQTPETIPALPTPPKTKDEMIKDQVYMTKHGPAKWDGTQYVKING